MVGDGARIPLPSREYDRHRPSARRSFGMLRHLPRGRDIGPRHVLQRQVERLDLQARTVAGQTPPARAVLAGLEAIEGATGSCPRRAGRCPGCRTFSTPPNTSSDCTRSRPAPRSPSAHPPSGSGSGATQSAVAAASPYPMAGKTASCTSAAITVRSSASRATRCSGASAPSSKPCTSRHPPATLSISAPQAESFSSTRS